MECLYSPPFAKRGKVVLLQVRCKDDGLCELTDRA